MSATTAHVILPKYSTQDAWAKQDYGGRWVYVITNMSYCSGAAYTPAEVKTHSWVTLEEFADRNVYNLTICPICEEKVTPLDILSITDL